MSKDLFEQQIGEALRKAESAPPAGAWEAIKSQIPSPYTPPFKFPTWTVVAISAVLLGSLPLIDSSQVSKPAITAITAIPLEVDQTMPAALANVHDDNVNSPDGEAAIAVQVSEKAEAVSVREDISITSQNDAGGLVSDRAAANVIDAEAPAADKEATADFQLPYNVQAVRPLSASVEQAEFRTNSHAATGATAPMIEKIVPSQLSIQGLTSCYTPCKLSLTASGNAVDYSWDAGSFGMVDGRELEIYLETPQVITFYSIGKYEDGSERVMPHTVEVKAGSELFVPNSFTPNGDGINDDYLVHATGIESFSLTIVNSKGKVVFQTSNINEAWRFDNSANELENEVYTAIVRATGVDGRVHTENQRLTILP